MLMTQASLLHPGIFIFVFIIFFYIFFSFFCNKKGWTNSMIIYTKSRELESRALDATVNGYNNEMSAQGLFFLLLKMFFIYFIILQELLNIIIICSLT
jgi:hypothetical protein